MKLSLHINQRYTRSVNLERDFRSPEIASAYIPTATSLGALRRISATFTDKAQPRSWAMIGPYGSGKSSFAVFLAQLMGSKDVAESRAATTTLRKVDRSLANAFTKAVDTNGAFCLALLTGSPERLQNRLIHALAEGAAEFWKGSRGRPPQVVAELNQAVTEREISTTKTLALIESLQTSIHRARGSGLLIVLDEFGKSLEYAARHNSLDDIYLLQAMAEHAAKSGKAQLHLVVLLHQAFEGYARGLGDQLRNEWKKVQGRFEIIPFLESAEQTLRVVAATLRTDTDDATSRKIHTAIRRVCTSLGDQAALPKEIKTPDLTELFFSCFPLHPVSALVLPTLCQKVAQNERTLFSFLGSGEPSGLKDIWSRRGPADLTWIRPNQIYDYFIQNQPGAIFDSVTHRRWAEVASALDRLGDAPSIEIETLKTIGIFNIIGNQGGLRASAEILRACLIDEDADDRTLEDVSAAIEALQSKSLINFRKYNSEYRVWQGSDFDLEAALRAELQKIGSLDVSGMLNSRKPLGRIVARRYSAETGAIRYFEPAFVSSPLELGHYLVVKEPTLLVCLPQSKDAQNLFEEKLAALSDGLVVAVVLDAAVKLVETVSEICALERIATSSPQLQGDPIAQREIQDRLQSARLVERDLLEGILGRPADSSWWRKGKPFQVEGAHRLQNGLSTILREEFHGTPEIRNELVNREKPSSTANGARMRLLMAMLEKSSEADLGIEKFPPEKAIYRAVLQAPGFHRQLDEIFRFGKPLNAASNIGPVWQEIEAFLDGSTNNPTQISVLFERLKERPFGVKAGLLPIIFMAAYMAHQDEIALFEEGRFVPSMTQELLERILRDPQNISVQRVRMSGINAALFQQYADMVTAGGGQQPTNLLAMVRPFAKFFSSLPNYSKRTTQLSEEARALRLAFSSAKSPSHMLFVAFPEALGVFKEGDQDQSELSNAFGTKLKLAIRELGSAYPNLLSSMRQKLATALHAKVDGSLAGLRVNARERYNGLASFTVDTEGLKAFLGRITDAAGSDDAWLEGVLSFLGRKPADKWGDEDIPVVEYRLSELAQRVLDLERLRLAYKSKSQPGSENIDAIILRVISAKDGEQERLIYTSQSRNKALNEAIQRMREVLSSIDEADLRLLALTSLASEEMQSTAAIDQTRSGKRTATSGESQK
jgi:hypothetical protein